ncbi:MAG: DUF4493 domain-containing protein [Bacteroidales bacterium]
MRKLLFILTAITLTVVIFVFQGCSGKENWDKEGSGADSGKGTVQLKLSSAGDFTTPATKGKSVDVNNFKIRILKGTEIYKTYAKYSDVPSVIEIDPGTYTMEAGSTETGDGVFSQPIYFGKSDFTIEAGKVASVNVVCALVNMKVTIRCSERFLNEFNDNFQFVVKSSTDGFTTTKAFLTYTKREIMEGISGYFNPASLRIDFEGTRKLDHTEITDTREISGGAAKDHHVLNYDAQETGGVEISKGGISVDYTVNNKTEEIIIPGEDQTPVDPTDPPVNPTDPPVDPTDPPVNEYLPTITGDGIGTPLRLSDTQAASATVQISVAALNGKTIQSLMVEIDSPYLTKEFLAGVNIPTKFDLANFATDQAGQTLKGMLAELGLISVDDPVKGKTAYSFSIGTFMILIESLPNGQDQTHKFIVTVVDSDGKSKTDTLSVIRYKGN